MSQENVREYLRDVRIGERFLDRMSDPDADHNEIVELAKAEGFEFTSQELKDSVKAIHDEDPAQLPDWIRERVRDQYLSKWID